ncbi:MAG: hypothetical protein F4X68_10010 [Acidimicrobiia bacterium]|nr:hypothetical protein [Acidimicrobiia bacterium]MYB74279.1 hypothetical protein [Acidimicrobiia bacterium]
MEVVAVARIPRGYRNPEDEPLFKRATNDPSICPDTVTASVEGYFRVPAIWIGEEPSDTAASRQSVDLQAEVVSRQLRAGIEVRVLRDGTFLFDFASWDLAPPIVIPGYRVPSPGMPHRVPLATEEASSKSEQYAVLRAQTMNVHQSCLATSEWMLSRSSHDVGLPLTAANTLKGRDFTDCLRYSEGARDISSIYRNIWNQSASGRMDSAWHRLALDIDVVHHSLDTLDEILAVEDAASLIPIVEAVYLASCRYTEGRLGEAIILAWGACEQLLAKMWGTFLKSMQSSGRLTGQRRSRLGTRDYTVSVRAEMLELGSRLDYELYRQVDDARIARNKWAHDMKAPSTAQLHSAMSAAEGLFEEVYDIRLRFPLNAGSPGVPAWNVWVAADSSNRVSPHC